MSANTNSGRLSGKVAVITGAGTGVGQACAWRLAREGASVVLVGRTAETLKETEAQLPNEAQRLVYQGDVASDSSMSGLAQAVEKRFGRVDIVVHAAGINVPKRALDQLSVEDYRKVVGVNLDGAFLSAHYLLPMMRQQQSGTFIFIVSDAGLRANVKAGAAYVASKFGLQGLVQSINLEEQPNGIRASAIFPGDINTPLLDRRPVPPPPEAREKMLQSDDLADCVLLVATLPARAVVESMLVRPLNGG
ncbi:MAG TPA: SDR family oxidoreductase [Chloroflexia bacterium]|nr:SDR family oxidoreductase [Chloroflexia bacterium]